MDFTQGVCLSVRVCTSEREREKEREKVLCSCVCVRVRQLGRCRHMAGIYKVFTKTSSVASVSH